MPLVPPVTRAGVPDSSPAMSPSSLIYLAPADDRWQLQCAAAPPRSTSVNRLVSPARHGGTGWSGHSGLPDEVMRVASHSRDTVLSVACTERSARHACELHGPQTGGRRRQ